MRIEFVILHDPPRVTAQQRKVAIDREGRPHFYAPERLKAARNIYLNDVWKYRPEAPLEGPLKLTVSFNFSTDDKKKWGKPKTTRPDTDNMIKALKDVLTAAGFWKDDSQVCHETVSKYWYGDGRIYVSIEEW